MQERRKTSWQKVSKWYDKTVGEEGHYYHQNIILPKILPWLDTKNITAPAVLDLACGQGILSRHISDQFFYVGIDAAPALIKLAKQYNPSPKQEFYVGDITKPLPIKKRDFSHAALILAVQNLENPFFAFKNAFDHLKSQGKFIIVMNHPCFRIPRQSSWKVDEENQIKYRRIDRYFSEMKIPIQTHPGLGEKSSVTWSFHHPLSAYSDWLAKAGFVIEKIEEWVSDKTSQGKAAKMENRAREEFPLFLSILAKKE